MLLHLGSEAGRGREENVFVVDGCLPQHCGGRGKLSHTPPPKPMSSILRGAAAAPAAEDAAAAKAINTAQRKRGELGALFAEDEGGGNEGGGNELSRNGKGCVWLLD